MTRRKARILFSLLVTILVAGVVLLSKQANIQHILPIQTVAPGFYHVAYVYDGDTIAVDMNGVQEKVRLIGVDTPETHKPNTPVQCYGEAASTFSNHGLLGKDVRLEADPLGDNRDRYGRLLRYVFLPDGTLWDAKLISEGYGFAYLSFPFSRSDDFAVAQDQARAARAGLWAACTPHQSGGRWQSQ